MPETPLTTIDLVLISHTNNGKTTLARTLLGQDVGEVRDAAHVTVESRPHELLRTDEGDVLLLWDTPGFGDSVRLARRMAMSGNPIGWLMSEVVDRLRDRPFWLSQQALRSAREAADVVLYLVNASEDPRDAGYLAPEMQLLAWLDKPAIVLLNQTGVPLPAAQARADETLWTQHLAQYPVVRRVLSLDAFTRCWVHERVFYRAVGALLPDADQAAWSRLLELWESRNRARMQAAAALAAQQIATAVRDVQPIPDTKFSPLKILLRLTRLVEDEKGRKQAAAMDQLLQRLQTSIETTTVALLELHRIEPGAAESINASVAEHFSITAPAVDEAQAGLLGAVVSGLAVGVKADLLTGGLTAGAGALIGGVVGALSFAGAAWGFNTLDGRHAPQVRFSDAFLNSLVTTAVLRYLAIAHFGRGRGRYAASEGPDFWRTEVDRAQSEHAGQLEKIWQSLRTQASDGKAENALTVLLSDITERVLQALYPDSLAPAER
ncbi:MAG: DUF3482 domain-containing protein [Burkholderiaceae bacterium]